jgi:hypothetical protein
MARTYEDTPNMDPTASARRFAAVTASDTVNFNGQARAVYVGGAGNVAAVGLDDVAVTFVGVTAGSTLPIQCKRINNTNTTATSMVALF